MCDHRSTGVTASHAKQRAPSPAERFAERNACRILPPDATRRQWLDALLRSLHAGRAGAIAVPRRMRLDGAVDAERAALQAARREQLAVSRPGRRRARRAQGQPAATAMRASAASTRPTPATQREQLADA
jgi:hypothetical protein